LAYDLLELIYDMKKIVFLSFIVLFAQGCTSIAQPTASLSLVENQFVAQTAYVNSSLSTALSNSKEGTFLDIQEQTTVIGNKFFAATGFTCRKLLVEQKVQDLYCLNDLGDWFKVNKVISEYNEANLREVGL
jgi:hypothetical protein